MLLISRPAGVLANHRGYIARSGLTGSVEPDGSRANGGGRGTGSGRLETHDLRLERQSLEASP